MADAGYRLAVEGEKEFKQALAEINAQIRVNKSELKLLTAEYDINDDKLGNLQKKQAALTTEMENQTKKVKVAEERYKAWAAELGEGDTKVLRLKESLNLAQTELAQTTAEWEKNQKAIEGFGRGTDDAESNLRRLDAILAANRSEMKLVETQYKDTADQSEKLQKQNALLVDSVELQKEKIEQLTTALNQAEAEYGDGSEAVAGYKKELTDAKIELVEMEDQIGENNRALEGSGDSADGLREALGEVANTLGIDIPPGIESLSGGFVGAAAAAGGIAVAVKKGLDAMKETAAYADDVLTESIISGVDTTTYQQLKYMEGLMDVSTETFTSSLTRIKRAMDDAASGNDTLAERFDRLGVSVTDADGNLRNSWDVFLETIDALGNMANETERDAIAMDLMGKSAEDLNPLIEAGADHMKALADEAERVGYVLTEDELAAAGEWQDFLDRLTAQTDSLARNIGLVLIETVRLADGNATLGEVGGAWKRLGDTILGVMDTIHGEGYSEDTYGKAGAAGWVFQNSSVGNLYYGVKEGIEDIIEYFKGGDVQEALEETEEAIEQSAENMAEYTEERIAQIEEMYESELQTISESIESRQELLEEANKQELEEYKDAQDQKMKAFEKQQSAELKAFQKTQSQRKKDFKEALDAEMEALDEAHKKKLEQINEEYTERIKLVDEERYNAVKDLEDQIAALDALTEAEEKAEEEREALEELRRRKEAIAEAETAEEKEKAQKEYEELLDTWRRERVLKEREAQKEELQAAIDAVNEEYDKRVLAIEEEVKAKEEQATSEYDIAKKALEEEHAMRQEKFDEQMENELTSFRETQDAQKTYFKDTLDKQTADHVTFLEGKLKDLQKELDDEIKAEEEAARKKKEIWQEAAENNIDVWKRMNEDYVKETTKTITENLPFLDRAGSGIASLPTIPRYASGTLHHPGGLALVGEQGPELVRLPAGTAVYPNEVLRKAGGSVVNYYNVTIPASDIKEFNDIVRIAGQRRQQIRMASVEG